MPSYWPEFLAVAGAHLLAVASPGPDFAIVVKQSLTHGRRTAVWTSLGVGTAILLHVTYSLVGIGLLIRSSELCFTIVKFAGAAYIAWLGVQSLRTQPRSPTSNVGAVAAPPVARSAFATGFFTNALNPKVGLFFIALFTVVIDPHTPRWIQAGYGLWMSVATAGWFTLVSFVFAHDRVRQRFLRSGHWIDRVLGVVFLAFAISLAVASMR